MIARVQPDMFDGTPWAKPRPRRRRLMHVYDAGYSDGRAGFVGDCVMFQCAWCGYRSGWLPMRSVGKEKRGRPCPECANDVEVGNGHLN